MDHESSVLLTDVVFTDVIGQVRGVLRLAPPIPVPLNFQRMLTEHMITLSKIGWETYAVEIMEAEYLISLLSPYSMIPTPSMVDSDKHLKLEMDDIEFPIEGMRHPHVEHVRALLEFGQGFDEETEIVVHCYMGRSRSAAALLLLLVQQNPERIKDVVDMVYREALHIKPNGLLVKLGDAELGCDGELIDAVNRMPEPWTEEFHGIASFPLRL